MHMNSVKLLIPISRVGGRMVRETILLKQTYPDELNKQVSCSPSSLPVLNARPVCWLGLTFTSPVSSPRLLEIGIPWKIHLFLLLSVQRIQLLSLLLL